MTHQTGETMPLIEREIEVTTKHGRCLSFTACPEAESACPGIILYMDAPGYREELKNMARRIARHGYYCLVPDMYYRYGTLRFDTARRNDAMSNVIKAAWTSLTNADLVDDTAGFLAHLDAQPNVTAGAVGCVGYCMSGQFVTTIAARYAHRFGAVASLYGVKIVTDQADSPHLLVDQIKGEMLYLFAETDGSVPEHVVPTLQTALERAGVKHRIKTLPGTQHGFQFPERAAYAAAQSEQAWTLMFDLWDRNLK
jgi:carboxymethylenebutenolidase